MVGETVRINGWVETVRSHGKIAFCDIDDRTARIQVVGSDDIATAITALSQQDAIEITGLVKERGERYINSEIPTGSVEIEASEIKILAKAATVPFDMGGRDLPLELPTLLDFRALTLKHPKIKMIFKMQAALADAFRASAKELGCTEIFVPTIAAGATEGGAEVFKIDYYGKDAFLTQSPQLYKQIMVGAFERVFTIAKAYRAEPSVTTRHLAEATQMDIEIGFIESYEELLDALEFVGTNMIKTVTRDHRDIFQAFEMTPPLVTDNIPRLKLREAQDIVSKRTGRDLSGELDLNPEDEQEICKWAQEEHMTDFVTITHFPTQKRAFYTMPDPKDPEYSLSYDLLFRGIEILSGSQRIHNAEELTVAMEKKGVDPKNFKTYLMAFEYGMPPEGGFSFGLERLTMKVLGLENVRQASLFPRDMERVDEKLKAQESPKHNES